MKELSQEQLDVILGHVIANHPDDVRTLLKKHGVANASSMASNDLSIAFLKAIKDDAAFRDDVASYLTGMIMYDNQNSSFVRGNSKGNFNVVSLADADAADTSTPAASTKSNIWSTLGSSQNINTLLSTGLGVLSSGLQNKANKDSEQRALQAKALDLQIAQTNAAAAATAANKPSGGIGVWGIIGIIGAIGAVAAIVIVVAKKRGRARAAKAA